MSAATRSPTTASPPTLSVELTEAGVRARLDLPSLAEDEPLQGEVHQPIDRASLEALQASAEMLLRGSERPTFPDEARTTGGVLYRALIPERLRARLRACEGPLVVSTTLYGLPWELLHDGEEFWGVRYALGRRLITPRPTPALGPVRFPERPRALVIGANPRDDLPFVAGEIEQVTETLAAAADVVCVGGALATLESVAAYLSRGFDLVHFAGHVGAGAGGEPALLLADERVLTATAIESTLAGHPMVFLNGCASARGAAAGSVANWERAVAGVAYGFLFGGAGAVVGTQAPVGDHHAAALAQAFYRHLFGRASVGEALRLARAACRADPVTAGSPTWLSFGLYGTPSLALASKAPRARPPFPVMRTSRRALLAGGLAVAAAGLGSLLVVRRRRGVRAGRGLVVGVMEAQIRAGQVPDWMRTFSRHALNTALREVEGVSVFSQEKIDFLCTSRALCGIAGAEALGMSKMITLALSQSGDTVALEVEVIDVERNGLLALTERVQGPQARLIELQNEIILRLLRGLGVTLTAAERTRILEERTNDMLDGYRMLMETLGRGAPSPRTSQPSGRGPRAWRALGLRVAHADEPLAEEAEVREALSRYAAALTGKDVEAIARLQVGMDEAQRAALDRYFRNAGGLSVTFSGVEVLVEGAEALATYTREDTFTDARTGRAMRLKVQMSSRLARQGGRWLFRLPE